MSETRRTPSATVNPSSDLLDLFARWTDLNNFTVLEVLWFVICSQLAADIDDANFGTILEYPACALTSFTQGTKEVLVDVNILCVDDDDEMSALLKVAGAYIILEVTSNCNSTWSVVKRAAMYVLVVNDKEAEDGDRHLRVHLPPKT